ncbi:hypothetical protein HT031_000055 [Scenedesmus sp. PABB004]|nr:hypothetical protein HT031_000055 [Scenedesmus sp. PABB004]
MADLSGKVALVTGATSGIGQVTAEYLAEHGATVILGVRNTDAGAKLAKEIMAKFPGSKVEVGPPLDLMRQESVKAFAATLAARPGPLNILVNNAGLGYTKKSFTEQGVGMLTQVNHLGPYTLTRLLEKKLVASKARVVNVVSVTHRITTIRDARALFTDWKGGFYQHNKLANVYTAFELQRRRGRGRGGGAAAGRCGGALRRGAAAGRGARTGACGAGVRPVAPPRCAAAGAGAAAQAGRARLQAVAADPGAVRTNIYNNSPKLGRGFIKTLIDNCYAPPEDGAQAVIYAATCDWDADKRAGKDGSPLLPHQDLRYYARGVFTWPQLCNDWALGGKGLAKVKGDLWGGSTVFLSFLDWPLRKLLGNGLMGRTKLCRPGSHAYDEKMAAAVWDVSAEFAGVPAQPQV